MDGFKDSSKTVWIAGGYAKGGAAKQPMSKGGPVRKIPFNMVESTSARPTRIPLDREVATPAERAAIARGNRSSAEEQASEALLMRRPRGVPVAPREPLIGKACGGLAAMPRGKK